MHKPNRVIGISLGAWSPAMVYVTSFLSLFLLGVAWAFATPLFAGADEPQHMATAYSVVRGNFGAFDTNVQIEISEIGIHPCFAGQIAEPAGCMQITESKGATGHAYTQVASYFPLYYLTVGIPTLFLDGVSALYGMRIANAMLFALVGAIGFWAIRKSRASSMPVVGVATLFAYMPMSQFLAGTVNSSALEVASAVSLWVCTVCLFTEDQGLESVAFKAFFKGIMLCAILLVFSRLLAPLWIPWILLISYLINPTDIKRAIQRIGLGRVMLGMSGVGIALVLTLGWAFFNPNRYIMTGPPVKDFFDFIEKSAWFLTMKFPVHLVEAFGFIGWGNDLLLPWALIATTALTGGLIGILLVQRPSRSQKIGLFLAVSGPAVITTSIAVIAWSGIGWQGRYSLPLLAGIPIAVAGAIQTRLTKSVTGPEFQAFRNMALSLFSGVSISSFILTYWRFSRGIGPEGFGAVPNWSSPVPFGALLSVFAFAQVLILICVVSLNRIHSFRTANSTL